MGRARNQSHAAVAARRGLGTDLSEDRFAAVMSNARGTGSAPRCRDCGERDPDCAFAGAHYCQFCLAPAHVRSLEAQMTAMVTAELGDADPDDLDALGDARERAADAISVELAHPNAEAYFAAVRAHGDDPEHPNRTLAHARHQAITQRVQVLRVSHLDAAEEAEQVSGRLQALFPEAALTVDVHEKRPRPAELMVSWMDGPTPEAVAAVQAERVLVVSRENGAQVQRRPRCIRDADGELRRCGPAGAWAVRRRLSVQWRAELDHEVEEVAAAEGVVRNVDTHGRARVAGLAVHDGLLVPDADAAEPVPEDTLALQLATERERDADGTVRIAAGPYRGLTTAQARKAAGLGAVPEHTPHVWQTERTSKAKAFSDAASVKRRLRPGAAVTCLQHDPGWGDALTPGTPLTYEGGRNGAFADPSDLEGARPAVRLEGADVVVLGPDTFGLARADGSLYCVLRVDAAPPSR